MPRRSSPRLAILALLTLFATAVTGFIVPAAAQADATLNITFVSCPPGGDWNGPPPGCTQVVEAPEHATVTGPAWTQPVHELPRNADGSYTVPDVPAGEGEIGLVNFFSPNHNAFTFSGTDTVSRWYGAVNPAPGELREITVYYWNGPIDLIMPPENTLIVNMFTCDDGIDPAVSAADCEPYTGELPPSLEVGTSPLRGIEMDDYLSRDGGTLTYDGLPPYTQAQVVAHETLAGYAEVLVVGPNRAGDNDAATAFLLRNESAVVDVYFHEPDGTEDTGTWTLSPGEDAEDDGGTLRLLLLQCPPGVVPHDDPAACSEWLAAGPDAGVTFTETGERMLLSEFDRDTSGAYLVTDVQGAVTIDGIVPGPGMRIASDADEIEGETITYLIDDGETRDGRLYYFDAG